MTQPPVLFKETARTQQSISLLFADAQTHYSEFKGNLLFENNACLGDGAMIKSWQTNFQNNIVADSSMPRAAWIGSYSGPVGLMSFTHNVYWNATGYCGAGWPSTQSRFVAPPHSPTGLGMVFLSGNYALDNGNPAHSKQNASTEIVGYGGVLGNATGTCYHSMDQDSVTGAIGCNHYPNCNWAVSHFTSAYIPVIICGFLCSILLVNCIIWNDWDLLVTCHRATSRITT